MSEVTNRQIERIWVTARYGIKQDFNDIELAIKYVSAVSKTTGDSDLPLDEIEIRIEYVNGDYEQCGWQKPGDCLSWLRGKKEALK